MRAFPRLSAWPRRLGLLALACALSACSHLAAVPHPPTDDPGTAPSDAGAAPARLALQGQLSLKLLAWQDLPAKGLSLGFFFSGHTDQGLLDLMTPLGTLMAQVGWHADEAWVVNQEGRQAYPTLDELSRQTLGEALPLRSLVHWMQGQPDPTQPSRTGKPQLSPRFVEWMMGLPAGWVTDVPISRANQLRALGNGVVPQQGAAAITHLLERK